MNRVDKRNGFTLIELMLAMSFVSMLLIAIALTVIQIGNIYNQGLTLKEVNQAGRSITSELQRSIAVSSPFNINSGIGSRYIVQDWGGRLCIGQYSYIWNYGSSIKTNDDARLNIYSNSSDKIRFVKAVDPNASYCTESSKKIDHTTATELLSVSEHDLAIHSFTVSTSSSASDSKTGQQLYDIEFFIGTNDQNALTTNSDTGAVMCKPPNQPGADPAYCSVNQFNIVARAGNSFQ
jgi:type II secretory pathway pseudopilin PulG